MERKTILPADRARKRTLPTIKRLREVFDCDQVAGRVTWKVTLGRRAIQGNRAGGVNARGYRSVVVDGVYIREHRLIWALCTGAWPVDQLDHINGVKDDNRPENLRECTNSENARCGDMVNSVRSKWGRGISKLKSGRFAAQAALDGRNLRIGTFDTHEEARAAYRAWAADNWGAFAPQQLKGN